MATAQDVRHTAGPVDVFDGQRPLRPYILAMTVDAQRYQAPVAGVTLMFGEPGGGGLYWPTVGVGGISLEECRANARLLAAAYTSYDRHCGSRALCEAEADLLGDALAALREVAREHPNERIADVLRRAGR